MEKVGSVLDRSYNNINEFNSSHGSIVRMLIIKLYYRRMYFDPTCVSITCCCICLAKEQDMHDIVKQNVNGFCFHLVEFQWEN